MPGHTDSHPELPLDPDVAADDRPLHLQFGPVLLVAVGGAAGTLARYGVTRLEPAHPGAWPWPTFIVNVIGAFVLGALLEALARSGPDSGWRQRARLLFGTGFCGALTTYSTLAVEADLLIRSHDSGLALGYLAASLLAGLVASVAGVGVTAGRHRLHRRAVA